VSLPRASIVTPSLNAARYIAEAVKSVLAQDYPSIEYIVVDGGSTDGTLEVLARFGNSLHLIVEPDSGPVDAINRGFGLARGEIFAWLAADDFYFPGAVSAAAAAFAAHPNAGVVYGEGVWVDAAGRPLGDYPTRDFSPELLAEECFICQPAAFLRREAFESAGGLDPRRPHTYDYDLWIRLARQWPFERIPARLAASRMHPATITLGARRQVLEENIRLLVHHYGYAPLRWVFAYAAHLIDRRDQFFEPLRPSPLKFALSLPLGLWFNRRRPARFLTEWLAAGRRAAELGGAYRVRAR
jgi:glycosyltransferase involved in cell wall biosynthesis